MDLKKTFISLFVIFLSLNLITVAESVVATHAAESCSYAHVSAAISAAASGDTINVPAGSCSWSNMLTITKGINLIGAGIGNTVITNNGSSGSYLISYVSSSNSQHFRVSGFTFDMNGSNRALRLKAYAEPTSALVRIDHNRFTNSLVTRNSIMNWGAFGVIDNNTFDNVVYPLGLGNAQDSSGYNAWNSYPDDFHGTSLNMFVEDNTFSLIKGGAITDCDQGGAEAFRYNTITLNNNSYNVWDQHEWNTSGYGCRGAVLYGNYITDFSYEVHIIANQGAGKLIVHHNVTNSTTAFSKLYSDGGGGCPPTYPANFTSRQPLNNSYLFVNRKGGVTGSLIPSTEGQDICGTITIDSTYWMSNSSCTSQNTCSNITSGVGCGTLADRPVSCATGTSYWATNQSCSDLTGMVGVNPTTPISGILYKCTSTDTWTAFYTPYTYPHPLREVPENQDTGIPGSPENLRRI